jgi:hypothetical protein
MDKTYILFRVVLSVVILIESIINVIHSLHSQTVSHLGAILPWFAGLEAIAAVMLLIPQTLKIGGWILLVIFAAAIIVHGPVDEMALFVYAAGVMLLITHGSASLPESARSDDGDLRNEK